MVGWKKTRLDLDLICTYIIIAVLHDCPIMCMSSGAYIIRCFDY